MEKINVVIPAYNESLGIEKTLLELCEVIPDNYSIIVVDDGSTDNTSIIVSSINSTRIRLIKHDHNRGYGSSIKTACRHADGEIIAWYDADGQHRPEDLISVVEKLIEEDLDYVIGIRSTDSHVEKSRKFGKKMLSWIANKFAKETMEDVNSGMRAFKREVLLRHISLLPNRFGASTVSSFIMQEMDYLGGVVPITVRQRVGVSTVKPIRDGIATLRLIMNIVILFRAKQILTRISLFFIFVGLIYGIIRAIFDKMGFPVLSSIIIVSGIQLFFSGIIVAQIGTLRLENCYIPKE